VSPVPLVCVPCGHPFGASIHHSLTSGKTFVLERDLLCVFVVVAGLSERPPLTVIDVASSALLLFFFFAFVLLPFSSSSSPPLPPPLLPPLLFFSPLSPPLLVCGFVFVGLWFCGFGCGFVFVGLFLWVSACATSTVLHVHVHVHVHFPIWDTGDICSSSTNKLVRTRYQATGAAPKAPGSPVLHSRFFPSCSLLFFLLFFLFFLLFFYTSSSFPLSPAPLLFRFGGARTKTKGSVQGRGVWGGAPGLKRFTRRKKRDT
jgi:hypothetical protein